MTPEKDMNLKDEAIKGLAWSSIENWGVQILGFLVYAGLARLVGPETFGVVAIAGLYVAFVQVFVSQGLSIAIIQRKELEPQHLHSAFWIGLTVAVLLCLLTMLLSHPIAALFREPTVSPVLMWLSLQFLINAFRTVPSAILTRELAFKALAIRSLAGTGVGGGVGLLMAFSGWGVWSLVAQQLVSASVGVACLWWATSWRPQLAFSMRHFRDLYSFALNILGNDVVWFFAQRSDQTLVGYGFGAIGLGPYSLANRLTQVVLDALVGPLQSVALPTLSRLQDDPERLKAAFYRFTELGALLCFPAFAGIIAIAPDLVNLLFGAQWSSAIPILRILACYGLLRVGLSFIHPLMLSKGRPGLYLLMFVASTIATFLACVCAIRWSPLAVAMVVTVVQVVAAIVFIPVLTKLWGISGLKLLRQLLLPSLASIIMFAIVALTQIVCRNDAVRMCLSIIVGMISYVLLLVFISRDRATDVLRFGKARLVTVIPFLRPNNRKDGVERGSRIQSWLDQLRIYR